MLHKQSLSPSLQGCLDGVNANYELAESNSAHQNTDLANPKAIFSKKSSNISSMHHFNNSQRLSLARSISFHFISFRWHFFLSSEAKSHQKWMLKILSLKLFHLLDATFDRFTQSVASMTFTGTAWNRYGCHRFHRFSLTWHFRGGSCKSFWIVRNRSSPNLDAL